MPMMVICHKLNNFSININWSEREQNYMADNVASKRTRNSDGTSPTSKTKKSKGKNHCVSCGNAVVDDAVECQWCGKWEHKNCVKISDEEYEMIDQCSQNILFFCSKCLPNLPIAMEVSKISENLLNLLKESFLNLL